MGSSKIISRFPSDIVIRPAHRQDDGPALASLLDEAFPNTFEGRTFYKQQPHFRLLAFNQDQLIGHVGIDLRVISIDGKICEIIGIIDLCVSPASRDKAVGSALINAAEDLGVGRDFAVLFADDHRIYHSQGYRQIAPALTRWFAIDELQSHSVIERDLSDCFMAKSLGSLVWPSGKIDLLGYLF